MAMEIELKLTLAKDHLEMLKQHPLLTGASSTAYPANALQNIYFDTPDHKLSEHRVALRIRHKQGRFIQTFKTQGHSEAGLHARNEWEWEVPSAELDLSLIDDEAWPSTLDRDYVTQTIAPVFSTDFVRQVWWYEGVGEQGEPVAIEVALDTGAAWAEIGGERVSDDICEVELELKQGEASSLFQVAMALAQRVPLLTADTSKAERGYRLHRQGFRLPARTPIAVTQEMSCEAVYCELLQQEVALWPRYLEAWKVTGEWHYADLALASIRNIGALFHAFDETFPQDAEGDIDRLLTKLIRQMRDLTAFERVDTLMVGSTGQWSKQSHQRSAERLSVLLQTVEPGLLVLKLADLLVNKRWRARWTEAQKARAALPL
ncbi:MAG: inorganic triphosphatase [Pontibacterium sp.]